jgi:hypothetical protein
MVRYIVGFLLAVGLIIVLIVLIIKGLASSPQKVFNLDDYANTNTTVQLTIDSPVTAASNHHDIIINVGNIQASLTITQGYDQQIINTQAYPMNTAAYAVFLRSLMINGFTEGNNSPSLADEQGHCALGDRYIYEVINGQGSDLEHYWYTTCGTGTFEGNISVIHQLFAAQIPDYATLTANIAL